VVEVVAGGFGAAVTGGRAAVVGGLVGGGVALVEVVTPLVGGAACGASAGAAVVATSRASALTAWTDAARASVRGRLSIARTGSATAVNQTANNKRRRDTTYGCRTSSAWASRSSVLLLGVIGMGKRDSRDYGDVTGCRNANANFPARLFFPDR
jgi:hypothetical protein